MGGLGARHAVMSWKSHIAQGQANNGRDLVIRKAAVQQMQICLHTCRWSDFMNGVRLVGDQPLEGVRLCLALATRAPLRLVSERESSTFG